MKTLGVYLRTNQNKPRRNGACKRTAYATMTIAGLCQCVYLMVLVIGRGYLPDGNNQAKKGKGMKTRGFPKPLGVYPI